MLLDQEKTYAAYDKANIGVETGRMAEQIFAAWEGARALRIPKSYKGVTNIVVAGMGGSSLGAHLIKNVFASRLKIPVELVRDYTVPASVTNKTLFVISSFSGNTEEPLAAAKKAKQKKAKCLAIASGGKLAAYAKREKIPAFRFDPKHLKKVPRLGVGYSIMGIAGMLERAGVLKLSKKEVKSMMSSMEEVALECDLDILTKNNPAKTVASSLKGRAVYIVASEHLVGNAHIMSNQINESAKQFSDFLVIPELNHHLMEGLTHPSGFTNKMTVLMLNSGLYHPRNQERYELTAQVFEKQGARVIEYFAGGGSALEEAGEILQFGSFVSFYLGMLNKVNPEKIPFVDWFKEKMK